MAEMMYLDVTYQFEEGEAWGNVYDFERDQAKFLASIGLEGRVLKPVKGAPQRLVVHIMKIKKDILLNPEKKKIVINFKNEKKVKL